MKQRRNAARLELLSMDDARELPLESRPRAHRQFEPFSRRAIRSTRSEKRRRTTTRMHRLRVELITMTFFRNKSLCGHIAIASHVVRRRRISCDERLDERVLEPHTINNNFLYPAQTGRLPSPTSEATHSIDESSSTQQHD